MKLHILSYSSNKASLKFICASEHKCGNIKWLLALQSPDLLSCDFFFCWPMLIGIFTRIIKRWWNLNRAAICNFAKYSPAVFYNRLHKAKAYMKHFIVNFSIILNHFWNFILLYYCKKYKTQKPKVRSSLLLLLLLPRNVFPTSLNYIHREDVEWEEAGTDVYIVFNVHISSEVIVTTYCTSLVTGFESELKSV